MEDKLEKLKKKNDLSDIILEKDSSSGDNIKKLLLGAASLVLLFLIILIGMKMFNNSNISPSENLASVGDSIEKTGDTAADKAQTTLNDTEDTLFKSEAIIDENSETDLKFEEMVRKLKQQDAEENQAAEIVEVDKNLNTAADKTNEISANAKDSVVDKIKEVTVAPMQKAKVKVKEVAKIVVAPASKPEPKEIIVSSKPVYSAPPSPISSMSGYFIQVGATARSFPDRRFLQKIKNNGYDYIVHKVIIKGKDIKKVLVGPYQTREEARAELNNVQSSINPSAYIYRIK